MSYRRLMLVRCARVVSIHIIITLHATSSMRSDLEDTVSHLVPLLKCSHKYLRRQFPQPIYHCVATLPCDTCPTNEYKCNHR
jgi:hypothetical protein